MLAFWMLQVGEGRAPSHHCWLTKTTPKTSGNTGERARKAIPRPHKMALEGVEALSYLLLAKGSRVLQPPQREVTSDDSPLVSHSVNPVTIPVKLNVPSLDTQGNVLALLDLGCTTSKTEYKGWVHRIQWTTDNYFLAYHKLVTGIFLLSWFPLPHVGGD